MKLAAAAMGLALLGLMSGPPAAPAGRRIPLLSVVRNAVITQGFGCTSVVLEPVDSRCPGGHFHSGIDLAAPAGTPVRAAVAGTVRILLSTTGYGLHVVERTSGGAVIIYGHLEAALVVDGQSVAAGQEIGLVGSTGNATGPHLHLEVRIGGVPVDPSAWLGGAAQQQQLPPAGAGLTRGG